MDISDIGIFNGGEIDALVPEVKDGVLQNAEMCFEFGTTANQFQVCLIH